MKNDLELICDLVRECGKFIKGIDRGHLHIDSKEGRANFVTEYDKQVQERLRTGLLEIMPDAHFVGEEGSTQKFSPVAKCFIVDPIDGTTNFVQGFHNSCVSVGLMHRGCMEYGLICNPYDGELYTAQRGKGAFLNGKPIRARDRELSRSLLIFGSALYYRELMGQTLDIFRAAFPLVQDIRRFGSAALDLCYLAAGKAGVFYECRLSPWDYAAGSLIAEEAGCRVTQLDGSPLVFDRKCSVLAGSPQAYDALAALIKKEVLA
jgi:myo-inositol-1(or 4)-monophosphatase